jgi:CMP-N,N'-diacetyllegionaminic acid synthase
MYRNQTFLAVIPARGGSKRLPGKNLRDLNGKPLISWTIEACLKSQYIDQVCVTSDDDDILNIAKSYHVNTIERPKELSSDSSSSYEALKHALKFSNQYDYIFLAQPTSPLRNEFHIDNAIKFLFEKKADSVIGVSKVGHSPLWSNTLKHDLSMSHFLDESIINVGSQSLPDYYRINGAIYLCKISKMLSEKTLFLKDNIYAYKMERKNSIDIDEEIDFDLCKLYMR